MPEPVQTVSLLIFSDANIDTTSQMRELDYVKKLSMWGICKPVLLCEQRQSLIKIITTYIKLIRGRDRSRTQFPWLAFQLFLQGQFALLRYFE